MSESSQTRRNGRRRTGTIAIILGIAAVGIVGLQGMGYYRDTQLINALKQGDGPAALACLRFGANPNTQSYTEFWSPIDLYYEWRSGWVYRRYSMSALMLASIGGQVEVGKELIARGAEVNQATSLGGTALLCAVKYDHPEMVELLLAHGADPAHRDYSSDTASLLARKMKRNRISAILNRSTGARSHETAARR